MIYYIYNGLNFSNQFSTKISNIGTNQGCKMFGAECKLNSGHFRGGRGRAFLKIFRAGASQSSHFPWGRGGACIPGTNIARIAKAALHKLPGKSTLKEKICLSCLSSLTCRSCLSRVLVMINMESLTTMAMTAMMTISTIFTILTMMTILKMMSIKFVRKFEVVHKEVEGWTQGS